MDHAPSMDPEQYGAPVNDPIDVSPTTPTMADWTIHDLAHSDVSPLSHTKSTDDYLLSGRSDSVLNSPAADEPPSMSPGVRISPTKGHRPLRRKRSFQYTDLSQQPAPSAGEVIPGMSELPLLVASCSSCDIPSVPGNSHGPSSSLASTISTLHLSAPSTRLSPCVLQHDQLGLSLEDDLIANEPLRMKRRFPLYKHAKRLPRWDADGKLSHWGSADGGTWEVYATVIEPGVQLSSADDTSDDLIRDAPQRHNLIPAALNVPRLLDPRYSRVNHSEQLNEHESGSLRVAHAAQDNSSAHLDREVPSSSLSLFDFQFPNPSAVSGDEEDVFAELPNNVTPSPPSTSYMHLAPTPSPATLHYRGASFDVVNPHASLLLGNHNFETPAEIDGLLDDYFDRTHTDNSIANMTSIREKVSQLSLRSNGDSPRPRVLYDDVVDARRKILGTHDEWSKATRPVQYELASVKLSPVHPVRTDLEPMPLTTRARTPDLQVDPFADRADGFIEHLESDDSLPSIENARSLRVRQPMKTSESLTSSASCECSEARQVSRPTKRIPVASRSQIFYITRGRQPRLSEKSEPFDLYISDDGESIQHHKIDSLMDGPTSFHDGGAKQSIQPATPNQRSRAPSVHSGIDTDPTMREIIDGYDYTRSVALISHTGEDSSSVASSPADSVHGQEPAHGWTERPTAVIDHWSSKIDDAGYLHPTSSTLQHNLPTTPAPVYRARYRRNLHVADDSNVPTSERTYGETNQLLQITPTGDVLGTGRRSRGSFNDEHPVIQTGQQQEYIFDKQASASDRLASSDLKTKLSTGPASSRNLHAIPKSRAYSTHRRQVSSIYQNDNDSAWETQISDSEPDLSTLTRLSLDSYAGANVAGSRIQLTPIPASPDMLTFPGIRHSYDAVKSLSGQRMVSFDGHHDSLAAPQHTRSQQDVHDAIRYIQGQLVNVDEVSTNEKEARRDKAQKLEEIRLRNPQAVRLATEYIFRQPRHATSLHDIPVQQTDRGPSTSNRLTDKYYSVKITTPSSDQRHLLSSPLTVGSATPPAKGALVYSDTTGDVTTLQGKSPPLPAVEHGVSRWSPTTVAADWPFGSQEISQSARISRHESDVLESESIAKLDQTHRYPAGQQHGLHGLTESTLFERQGMWRNIPPHGTRSPSIHDPIGVWRPRIGTLTPNRERRLIRDRWDGANDELTMEAQTLSRFYLNLTALCPLTSLGYALGFFDRVIARKTKGQFTEMAPDHKRIALTRNFLISCVAWLCMMSIVGVVIWVCLARNG